MTSEREKCTEENGFWEGAEVISSYSPEQGVEDGVLVDVTATFREAGLPGLKCYMTRAAWEDCVAWDDSDGRRKGIHQDEAGRLWDVATMTRAVIQMLGSMDAGDTARVPVTRVPRAGKGRKPRLTFLKAGLEGGLRLPRFDRNASRGGLTMTTGESRVKLHTEGGLNGPWWEEQDALWRADEFQAVKLATFTAECTARERAAIVAAWKLVDLLTRGEKALSAAGFLYGQRDLGQEVRDLLDFIAEA